MTSSRRLCIFSNARCRPTRLPMRCVTQISQELMRRQARIIALPLHPRSAEDDGERRAA